jgi:hypothetical protein
MARVLRFADPELRAVVARSIEQYVTSLEQVLGRRPAMGTVRDALLEGFRTALRVELEPGAPTAAEEAAVREIEARFASDEWLHRVRWSRERPRRLMINGAVRYVEGATASGTPVTVRVVEGALDGVHVGGAGDEAEIRALAEKLVALAAA